MTMSPNVLAAVDKWLEDVHRQKMFWHGWFGREPRYLIVDEVDWLTACLAAASLLGRHVPQDTTEDLEIHGLRVVRTRGIGAMKVGR